MRARWLLAAAFCVLLGGCGTFGAPLPTPTSAPPPATPTPAATAAPTVDAQTADVQDAFLTTVNDLTNEVETLAGAPCPDLTAELQANPGELTSIRGFAGTLQRVSGSRQELNSDDVRSAVSDLNQAMTQLDTALKRCGINAT